MKKYPFDPVKETSIIGEYPGPMKPAVPIFDTPILPKENFKMALRGETPLWIPTGQDMISINLGCIPDNIARGATFDVRPLKDEEKGGKDMFGVEWVYVPVAMGSMVRPGKPLFEDANDWKEHIVLPDPDTWDWEANFERVRHLVDDRRLREAVLCTGLFERLVSFMDFENAALALVDEEQKEAVHELFGALCGVYEKIILNMIRHIGIDMVEFHDDWGSQRSPLFSLETCREMLVPHLRRMSDFAHANGIFLHFHSCGKNEPLVPAMIEAGADFWIPQMMNDMDMLTDTYGKLIMIGTDPDVIPDGATEEEICEMAKKFVRRHADNPRLFVFKSFVRHLGRPEYELYFNEVYKESRRVLSEKYA